MGGEAAFDDDGSDEDAAVEKVPCAIAMKRKTQGSPVDEKRSRIDDIDAIIK